MLIFIVRKSQCTGGNAKERGGAATAGHKRKLNHPVTTHNSKIPVAKSVDKRTMTAKDFDRIHQKNFNKSVVMHVHIRPLYIYVRMCICKICVCAHMHVELGGIYTGNTVYSRLNPYQYNSMMVACNFCGFEVARKP